MPQESNISPEIEKLFQLAQNLLDDRERFLVSNTALKILAARILDRYRGVVSRHERELYVKHLMTVLPIFKKRMLERANQLSLESTRIPVVTESVIEELIAQFYPDPPSPPLIPR